jgi:chromate transporter
MKACKPARSSPARSSDIVSAEVSFATAARFWLTLGWINFGGPAGQIALMHRELVERRAWIDEQRFLHALNYCMLLPGPEAMQLAIYIGWLLHGTRGAVIAGIGFFLPAVLILLVLSWAYASFGDLGPVAAVLSGFKPVVVAIVLLAVITVGRRALKRPEHFVLAAAAFLAIQFLRVPFPLIVLGAIAVGIALSAVRRAPARNPQESSIAPAPANSVSASAVRPARLIALWVGLSVAPLLALYAVQGPSVLAALYSFFTRAAYVTFGGAYAVLAYVNQAAVEQFGWLTASQAVDGFALAETTPGPLIMVLQFVGFMAGWNAPEPWNPATAAVIAALLTSYATFVPSFFFILLGAPYVERLRGVRWLDAALAAVTAAVVGVILNLAVVFGTAVLWSRGEWNVFAILLALIAALLLWRNLNVSWVVLGGGLVGLLVYLLGWNPT